MGRVALESGYKNLIDEYVALLKKHFGFRLYSVCLFGSVARGCSTAESDIDVLVVADGIPDDGGMRIREINYIHEKLKGSDAYPSLRALSKGRLISDLLFTPDEIERHPPLLLDIVEDGVILYDREDFLKNVLLSIKENLKRLGARKVITKKGYYWVLKPDIKPGEIVRV
jgi:hypothetical protein